MSDTTAEFWDSEIELPQPRANKPVTLGRKLQAAGFLGLMSILRRMPIETASRSLGKVMRVVGPLLGQIHHRGEANLRLVYPEMTSAERSAILRDTWENLGNTFAEYAHFEKLGDRVTVENIETLQQFTEEGKQTIFVAGHFANWEAMGTIIRNEGVKFGLVYRAPNNAIIDEHIIGLRAKAISRLQVPKGKRGGRELLTALKKGYSLTMLVDQKLNDGIEIPLLGHPAMTAPAPARLAKKMNMPLVPIQITRKPGARFHVTVHDPIEPGDRSVEEITTEVNEVIGGFILERPEQWLWFHRRWPADLTPA